jgi:hypothetical protein
MNKFPSAQQIIQEAKRQEPKADINQLHALTFNLMKKYRDRYYQDKVNEFIRRQSIVNLPKETKLKIKQELLKPIKGGDIWYSNFMEEASRRISQVFQPISGNLAELCVEKELIDMDLREKINYERKKERTDLIIYYPKLTDFQERHRVEVKNVKLRERGIRGFQFDGDSMIGFFDDPNEFTITTIDLINEHCKKTGGYCYVPPLIFKKLENKLKTKKFKSNREFASDMKRFTKSGII